MIRIAASLVMLWSSVAFADVLNVEFKFTPFTGDLKNDKVDTVPGKARIFLNNALMAEQDIQARSVPVIFDEREIASAVWVPMASVGPGLRKGRNRIRIEFEPTDRQAVYQTQLSWASVTDQTTESEDESGAVRSTNQSGEGRENKTAKGKAVLEREFDADFAADLPWHHYPSVSEISAADRLRISELVNARAADFKPDFGTIYSTLSSKEGVQVDEIRKMKCLDAAHAAGVRVAPATAAQLDFNTTGNAEVLVRRKGGPLFDFGGPAVFERIQGDDAQMCAGMSLSLVYPPQMAFVRTPGGDWEIAY